MGLGLGRDVLTDKSFFQDYKISRLYGAYNPVLTATDYALSQVYLAGRGDRSYFDIRSLYFYGFSAADSQGQIPIIHPVIDHDYTFDQSVFGGEVRVRSNLTSLSRQIRGFRTDFHKCRQQRPVHDYKRRSDGTHPQ